MSLATGPRPSPQLGRKISGAVANHKTYCSNGSAWKYVASLELRDAGHRVVVESIELTAKNDIDDAELLDCVRESAFTVDLPVEGSGRTKFEMTIPYGPPPSADAGVASGPR